MAADTADINFWLGYCKPPQVTESKVILEALTFLVAEGLRRSSVELALWVKCNYHRDLAIVKWPGDGGKPYEIYSWFASSIAGFHESDESNQPLFSSQKAQINHLENLVIPELGLDFDGIYYNEHPIFFYDFEDGDIVFANLAAVRAQNKKLKKLLGSSGASLNFPDEFEKRIERVWNREILTNYENEAMRWFLNPESGRYHRKRMKFVSNAGRISYGDTECWYSHTVYAEDTGKFVD